MPIGRTLPKRGIRPLPVGFGAGSLPRNIVTVNGETVTYQNDYVTSGAA